MSVIRIQTPGGTQLPSADDLCEDVMLKTYGTTLKEGFLEGFKILRWVGAWLKFNHYGKSQTDGHMANGHRDESANQFPNPCPFITNRRPNSPRRRLNPQKLPNQKTHSRRLRRLLRRQNHHGQRPLRLVRR